MKIFNVNLNIHWSAPDEVWDKLGDLYSVMPGWKGVVDGAATWYGNNKKIIEASSEPSGLQFYAEMPEEEWNDWIETFRKKASKLLSYEVGEIEEGYGFKYYE